MSIKKIVFDNGHAETTPGKRIPAALDSNQTREWTLNDRVYRYTIEELENYEGWEHIRLDDPTGQRDVPLSERSRKANNYKGDILISIHHNAGANLTNAGGIVVYAHNGPLLQNTLNYQRSIYNHLIKTTGLKGNRASPLARANFHMLREPRMSSLLLELGFMDSRTDAPIILTEKFARQAAEGIANFLVEEFKLKAKPKPTGKLWRVQVGAFGNYDNAKCMEARLKKDGYDTWVTSN